MKIFITCPNPRNPHGGLRVIFQWAEYLQKYHEVYLHLLSGTRPAWYDLKAPLAGFDKFVESDVIILTSPHSAHLLDAILPRQKCFVFLQMREDLFRPDDQEWFRACKKTYQTKYPLISISQWVNDDLRTLFGRNDQTFLVGNGIDNTQFPIEESTKDGRTVLIEGIDPGGNPSKDVDKLGLKVGLRLRKEGFKVLAYSQFPGRYLIDEYHQNPPLKKLNELYRRASVLIKASHYDARALAPLEAMTKGTVTARAIGKGDDDLNDTNSLRSGYNEEALYQNAKRLLTDHELRNKFSKECLRYATHELNWNTVITQVNKIICGLT